MISASSPNGELAILFIGFYNTVTLKQIYLTEIGKLPKHCVGKSVMYVNLEVWITMIVDIQI